MDPGVTSSPGIREAPRRASSPPRAPWSPSDRLRQSGTEHLHTHAPLVATRHPRPSRDSISHGGAARPKGAGLRVQLCGHSMSRSGGAEGDVLIDGLVVGSMAAMAPLSEGSRCDWSGSFGGERLLRDPGPRCLRGCTRPATRQRPARRAGGARADRCWVVGPAPAKGPLESCFGPVVSSTGTPLGRKPGPGHRPDFQV